jgi:hypothetical protein
VLHVPQSVSTPIEPIVSVWQEPPAEILPQREFASVEASLAIAVEALASARLVVEDAKRTVTATIMVNGRPAGGGRPIAPERVKERKLFARRLIRHRLLRWPLPATGSSSFARSLAFPRWSNWKSARPRHRRMRLLISRSLVRGEEKCILGRMPAGHDVRNRSKMSSM